MPSIWALGMVEGALVSREQVRQLDSNQRQHGEGMNEKMTGEFHDEGAGRGEPNDEAPRQEPGPEPLSLNPEEIEVPNTGEGEGAG